MENTISQYNYSDKRSFLAQQARLYTTLNEYCLPTEKYFKLYGGTLFEDLKTMSKKKRNVFYLTKYDLVPEEFRQWDNHQKLSFLITWKSEVISRGQILSRLYYTYRRGWYSGYEELQSLGWTLSHEQLYELIKNLWEEFFRWNKSIDDVIDVITSKRKDTVRWSGTTEALAYFLCLLNAHKMVVNSRWRTVIAENAMFKSKHGKIISDKNVIASYYRTNKRPFETLEMKHIKKLLKASTILIIKWEQHSAFCC